MYLIEMHENKRLCTKVRICHFSVLTKTYGISPHNMIKNYKWIISKISTKDKNHATTSFL